MVFLSSWNQRRKGLHNVHQLILVTKARKTLAWRNFITFSRQFELLLQSNLLQRAQSLLVYVFCCSLEMGFGPGRINIAMENQHQLDRYRASCRIFGRRFYLTRAGHSFQHWCRLDNLIKKITWEIKYLREGYWIANHAASFRLEGCYHSEWNMASILTKLFSSFVQRRTLAKARDGLFNLRSLFL